MANQMTFNEFLEYMARAYDKMNTEEHGGYYGCAFLCLVMDGDRCIPERNILDTFEEMTGCYIKSPAMQKHAQAVKQLIEDLQDSSGKSFASYWLDLYNMQNVSHNERSHFVNKKRADWLRAQKTK